MAKTESIVAREKLSVVAESPGLLATRALQSPFDQCGEKLRELKKESAPSLLVTASGLSVAERSECDVSAETTCSFLAAVCCVTAAADDLRRCVTFCQRSVHVFLHGRWTARSRIPFRKRRTRNPEAFNEFCFSMDFTLRAMISRSIRALFIDGRESRLLSALSFQRNKVEV